MCFSVKCATAVFPVENKQLYVISFYIHCCLKRVCRLTSEWLSSMKHLNVPFLQRLTMNKTRLERIRRWLMKCTVVAETDRLTAVATVSVNASDIACATSTRVLMAHQASVSISVPSSTTDRTKVVDMSTNQSIRQVVDVCDPHSLLYISVYRCSSPINQ